MQIIYLTTGENVLVDDSDFAFLSARTWYRSGKGYAITSVKTDAGWKNVYMHRMIICPQKGFEVDHKSRNKLDNQRANLRAVTRSQNLRNRNLFKNNKSGVRGVSYDKSRNKWRAQITVNGMVKHLGRYLNVTDALKAYETARGNI